MKPIQQRHLTPSFKARKGAAGTEYGILAGLISVAAIFAVVDLGVEVQDVFGSINSEIADIGRVGPATAADSPIFPEIPEGVAIAAAEPSSCVDETGGDEMFYTSQGNSADGIILPTNCIRFMGPGYDDVNWVDPAAQAGLQAYISPNATGEKWISLGDAQDFIQVDSGSLARALVTQMSSEDVLTFSRPFADYDFSIYAPLISGYPFYIEYGAKLSDGSGGATFFDGRPSAAYFADGKRDISEIEQASVDAQLASWAPGPRSGINGGITGNVFDTRGITTSAGGMDIRGYGGENLYYYDGNGDLFLGFVDTSDPVTMTGSVLNMRSIPSSDIVSVETEAGGLVHITLPNGVLSAADVRLGQLDRILMQDREFTMSEILAMDSTPAF